VSTVSSHRRRCAYGGRCSHRQPITGLQRWQVFSPTLLG